MISTLAEFVDELRAVGIPVSMVEAIDAAGAIEYTDLAARDSLRATLGATLVKNLRHYGAFNRAFDVYFGLEPVGSPEPSMDDGLAPGEGAGVGAGSGSGEDLLDSFVDALIGGDGGRLRRLVSSAVDRFAGMQPGRPVGGKYYAYRVLRRIDTDELLARLIAALSTDPSTGELDGRIEREQAESLVQQVREQLEQEITGRLIADRGRQQVAANRRLPLVEDVDLMHATRSEIEEVTRAIRPLARKLATRLGQRRRHGSKGRLDVRRTIRRSLGHGGVLLDPQFKPPTRSKPEIVILCDVSGSMATFARFTMQLTYAISAELARVRVFAFIDGIDDVTSYFSPDIDFVEGLIAMSREADIVRRDGHSDYGRSFTEMWDRYPDSVTSRSTVIVTGDARNNYRDTGHEAFENLVGRSRATFWLNPEPRRFWDTGDSVMSSYSGACDGVEQVRTLRQLEDFVERATLPTARKHRVASHSVLGN
ncbi:MAG: VWA domain-containing protein [Acidimicrobiia bacterium]|nr:MAG: VWA domain-containing protein [Acidimicrobiia bacterium]